MAAFPAFYGLFNFLRLFASKIFTLFVLWWDTGAEDNLRGDKLHDLLFSYIVSACKNISISVTANIMSSAW
jgi:hypothetical protein